MKYHSGHRLLLFLPLAFLVLFFYYPLGVILHKAFFPEGHFTLGFLQEIWSQDWQRSVILFTFKQAVFSLLVTLAIGLPITLIFTYYDFPFKRTIKAVSMIPFVLPGITVALGFILFFKGLIFLFGMSIASILDVVCAIIIIIASQYNLPNIIEILVAIFLFQKGLFSLLS